MNETITRTYDALNRVSEYTDFRGNTVKYSYDTCGNLIALTYPGGKIVRYTYNEANNLTEVTDWSNHITKYEYDKNGRLVKTIRPNGTLMEVTYNAAGQVNGKKTEYVYNPNTSLSEMLIKIDPDGNKTYYVYGLGLIGEENNNEYLTYHFDRRGSTIAITNMDSLVTDRFQYGAYGELTGHSGNTKTPFMYNGRDGVVTDSNGLYYMRARYYNPDIKRFINQDVVIGNVNDGRSLNRYAYVYGNPVDSTDPFGLSPEITASGVGHTILDVFGMVPVIGEVFDGANALWYAAE